MEWRSAGDGGAALALGAASLPPADNDGHEGGLGGEGGEQGSDNAKHNRSPQLRNLEELTALFKFNRRQDSLSDELKQCQAYIAKALESLGVDIGMIGD